MRAVHIVLSIGLGDTPDDDLGAEPIAVYDSEEQAHCHVELAGAWANTHWNTREAKEKRQQSASLSEEQKSPYDPSFSALRAAVKVQYYAVELEIHQSPEAFVAFTKCTS